MQTNKLKVAGVEVRYTCPQCNGLRLAMNDHGALIDCPRCQGEGHIWKHTEYGSKLAK